MLHRTCIGKILLQIAAAVFLMHAMSVYGSCCFVMPHAENVGPMMPCHAMDGTDTSNNLEDCWSICLLIAVPSELATPFSFEVLAIPVLSNSPLITGGIDPPFRPPISHLFV